MTTKKYLCITSRQKKNIVLAKVCSMESLLTRSSRPSEHILFGQIKSEAGNLCWMVQWWEVQVVGADKFPLQEELLIQRQVLVKNVLTWVSLQKVLLTLEGLKLLFDQFRIQESLLPVCNHLYLEEHWILGLCCSCYLLLVN